MEYKSLFLRTWRVNDEGRDEDYWRLEHIKESKNGSRTATITIDTCR